MQHTEKYELPIIEGTDTPSYAPFNEMANKLDTILDEEGTAVESYDQRITAVESMLEGYQAFRDYAVNRLNTHEDEITELEDTKVKFCTADLRLGNISRNFYSFDDTRGEQTVYINDYSYTFTNFASITGVSLDDVRTGKVKIIAGNIVGFGLDTPEVGLNLASIDFTTQPILIFSGTAISMNDISQLPTSTPLKLTVAYQVTEG